MSAAPFNSDNTSGFTADQIAQLNRRFELAAEAVLLGSLYGSVDEWRAEDGDHYKALQERVLREFDVLRADWTYDGYYTAVIGELGPASIVAEFGLDPSDRQGLSEWIGNAEHEAAAAAGIGIPAEWADHHVKALDELASV